MDRHEEIKALLSKSDRYARMSMLCADLAVAICLFRIFQHKPTPINTPAPQGGAQEQAKP